LPHGNGALHFNIACRCNLLSCCHVRSGEEDISLQQ
jgi:hypothetical protein